MSSGRSSHRSARADTNAIPVGVVSSPEPPAKIFHPVSQLDDSRHRHTQVAVGPSDPSRIRQRPALALMLSISRECRAAATPTMSAMESSAPTSWKCTRSGGSVVDSSLGLGKSAKVASARSRIGRGEICGGNEIFDRFPFPCRNVLGDHLYRYPVRVLSGSGHRCRCQPHRVSDHGVDGLLHDRQIRTRVDQRTQQHVARDPGGGIDPGMASAAHGAAIWAAR